MGLLAAIGRPTLMGLLAAIGRPTLMGLLATIRRMFAPNSTLDTNI
jgi:hypothetical protein